ncbi:CD99 antigen-like protein 2 isoform X2 [Mobula hypostoma]|uniref:CD99 antigen-like protein 2 isoform X2 n=1 Tax=Mobula hypostoma TaxID=723540 RepID=UPI002FC3951A
MFLRSFLFAYLAFVVVRANGQDDFSFNLEDALNEDPSKPHADEFDLSDAVGDDSHVPTGQDDFGFNLEDALNEDPAKPQGQDDFGFNLEDALNEGPAKPQEASDFDLSDALDDDSHVPTGQDDFGFNLEDALNEDSAKPQGNDNGFDLNDALRDDTVKPPDADGFDLRDALDDNPVKQTGGDFDDSDLEHVKNSGYKPDKTKSKAQDSPAETDFFSKLLMTILDGTSEHFKKICFSLMEMLNDLYNSQQDE